MCKRIDNRPYPLLFRCIGWWSPLGLVLSYFRVGLHVYLKHFFDATLLLPQLYYKYVLGMPKIGKSEMFLVGVCCYCVAVNYWNEAVFVNEGLFKSRGLDLSRILLLVEVLDVLCRRYC